MGKPKLIGEDLEKVVQSAFREAQIPVKSAIPLARLATHAICEYLIGTRVTFGKSEVQKYRDRAIYEAAKTGNSAEIAEAEGLTAQTIRKIIKKQKQERRKNDKS
jgi:Mor family transcriptional regulator